MCASAQQTRIVMGDEEHSNILQVALETPLVFEGHAETRRLEELQEARNYATGDIDATKGGHIQGQVAAEATLITVVHNPSLLPLLADRVIGLKQGKIAFDLPTAAVNDEKLANLYRPDAGRERQHWQLAPGQALAPTQNVFS